MSNMLLYEASCVEVSVDNDILRIDYIRCSPPARLKPKGTIILLHDFFRTSYQYRHVVDILAMGGYITVALDFPGKPIWTQQRPDRCPSSDQISASLVGFMRALKLEQPIHLVGCGLGALTATTIATHHLNLVASVVQAGGSSRNDLQDISILSISATEGERRGAFRQYLTSKGTRPCYSDEEIEDTVAAFANPVMLLAHKKIYDALVASDRSEKPMTASRNAKIAEQYLDITPEEEPEHFALSVLYYANDRGKETKQGTQNAAAMGQSQARPHL